MFVQVLDRVFQPNPFQSGVFQTGRVVAEDDASLSFSGKLAVSVILGLGGDLRFEGRTNIVRFVTLDGVLWLAGDIWAGDPWQPLECLDDTVFEPIVCADETVLVVAGGQNPGGPLVVAGARNPGAEPVETAGSGMLVFTVRCR